MLGPYGTARPMCGDGGGADVGHRADNRHHGAFNLIPHRGAEGERSMSREATYAFAIGATANMMFVIGATATLLAFALAYRPNDVSGK
jgi:hypothetical protein